MDSFIHSLDSSTRTKSELVADASRFVGSILVWYCIALYRFESSRHASRHACGKIWLVGRPPGHRSPPRPGDRCLVVCGWWRISAAIAAAPSATVAVLATKVFRVGEALVLCIDRTVGNALLLLLLLLYLPRLFLLFRRRLRRLVKGVVQQKPGTKPSLLELGLGATGHLLEKFLALLEAQELGGPVVGGPRGSQQAPPPGNVPLGVVVVVAVVVLVLVVVGR